LLLPPQSCFVFCSDSILLGTRQIYMSAAPGRVLNKKHNVMRERKRRCVDFQVGPSLSNANTCAALNYVFDLRAISAALLTRRKRPHLLAARISAQSHAITCKKRKAFFVFCLSLSPIHTHTHIIQAHNQKALTQLAERDFFCVWCK
jgi:hypothetical protein